MSLPSQSQCIALLEEWVSSTNLRKHMYAVEAAMRAYAKHYGEDEEFWGRVGLLHDFDYERYPTVQDHPYKGAAELRHRGYPEDFIATILAHAAHTNTPRDTQAKKCIFAVDELAGFIVAVALVRPSKKLSEVTVASVQKKMKDKAFARQVNREEIVQGAQELGLPLDQHIKIVLTALQGISDQLGL